MENLAIISKMVLVLVGIATIGTIMGSLKFYRESYQEMMCEEA